MFEIRDRQIPPLDGESETHPHELVITYYESADGKTRHSSVMALTDNDLYELHSAIFDRLMAGAGGDIFEEAEVYYRLLPVSARPTRVRVLKVPGGDYPQEYSVADPEGA